MPRRVTLADVAHTAGVSPTTVSHALSGKGRVDEATRRRVREAAASLGYVPNRAARNLALGRSDTIGLMLPRLTQMPLDELLLTDWYGQVTVCASQVVLRHHRALLILPDVRTGAELDAYALEGVLVLDPLTDDPRWPALRTSTTPRVLLGRDPSGELGPVVDYDSELGTRSLLDHMWERGARRPALVLPDIGWSTLTASRAAYDRWCAERGVRPVVGQASVARCSTVADVVDAAERAAARLLARRTPPDALIGLLGYFGRGIVAAAHARGLEVPQDLLVAQDIDGLEAQIGTPPITALDVDITDQLAVAVELLLSGMADPSEVRVVTPTLVVRGSTVV